MIPQDAGCGGEGTQGVQQGGAEQEQEHLQGLGASDPTLQLGPAGCLSPQQPLYSPGEAHTRLLPKHFNSVVKSSFESLNPACVLGCCVPKSKWPSAGRE